MVFKSIVGIICTYLAVASILCPAVVSAASVTYSFSGTVTEVPAEFSNVSSVGDLFTGTYTFDPDALPITSLRSYDEYAPITAFQFSSPTVSGSSELGRIAISNRDLEGGQSADGYRVNIGSFFSGSTISAPQVNGFSVLGFIIDMVDFSGSTFTSTALPVGTDFVQSFQENGSMSFNIDFAPPDSNTQAPSSISGRLNSLEATVVPLPSALYLFASGLLGLSFMRRKNA